MRTSNDGGVSRLSPVPSIPTDISACWVPQSPTTRMYVIVLPSGDTVGVDVAAALVAAARRSSSRAARADPSRRCP